LDLCGLEGQWKLAFDHSFRPCIYVECMYGKNVYVRIILRIYTPRLKCSYGHMNTDTEKFIYYTYRMYTAYIYLKGSGQP